MAEIILHLPDGTLLHVPEGMDPLAAARQYGDHQAAGAQDRASAVAGGSGLVDDAKTALGAAAHEFNPMTIGTNLLHSIFHPVDTVTGLASAVGNAIAHPIDTVKSLSDPTTGGKAIGDLGLLLATGRIPQAVSAVGRALPEGVGVTTAKLARAALEPKKQALGKLNEIIDASEAGPAVKSAPAPVAAAETALPNAAERTGVNGMSADEIASLRARGYNDDQIARVNAPKPKPARSVDLMKAAQGIDGPKPAFDWPEAGGRYEADAAGSHKLIPSAEGVPDFLQSELHSGYNNGHVLPEGMAPTERLAQASSSLETPHTGGSTFDADYGGFLPDVPKFDYEGGVPPSPVPVGEMPAPNPLSRLEAARHSLGGQPAQVGSDPTYTDWAKGMDDVINAAGEEDMPNAASSGLARSRPTNAIKDWMTELQQTNGRGWPFSEIQP